jgi:hypothetical protein
MPTGRPHQGWFMRQSIHAPVAQLDRVVASEAIGRGFESLRARQLVVDLSSRVAGACSAILGCLPKVLRPCQPLAVDLLEAARRRVHAKLQGIAAHCRINNIRRADDAGV